MSWQTTPANKPGVDLFAGMIAYDKPGSAYKAGDEQRAASSPCHEHAVTVHDHQQDALSHPRSLSPWHAC